MTSFRFEWDEAKNRSNQRKHGLSFEEASQAFRDPLLLSVQDRVEEGEQRWQAFGESGALCLWWWPTLSERRALKVRPWKSFASSRRGAPHQEKGGAMKKKMVSYTLDNLPPLTQAQHDDLARLAAMPDEQIDTSDIPELTDEQFKNADRGRFYRPIKRQITARVDADVLEWLQSQGKGYQSRINAILRREMLASLK
jgi:uncharacterized protein (DUF4415 family)/uncharacterized DUF497 family protein